MPSLVRVQEATELPTYFFGHAGVGLLWAEHLERVRQNLRDIGTEIQAIQPKPKAVIVVSGHFEAGEIHGPGVIEVNVKRQTPILHDFVNDFHDSRPEAYEYDWPHLDAPELAADVWKHLIAQGIKAKRVERGIDHGVWVPFKIMFPEDKPLEIPIILVSTYHGYDLSKQLELGEALAGLRSQGYLIVGSGMAVHAFPTLAEIAEADEADRPALRVKAREEAIRFDTALRTASSQQDAQQRKNALLALEAVPEFTRAHPTVEHLTPLYVAALAAGNAHVDTIGQDFIEPGFSYTNFRFAPV